MLDYTLNLPDKTDNNVLAGQVSNLEMKILYARLNFFVRYLTRSCVIIYILV